MAICSLCDKEMKDKVGCLLGTVEYPDGTVLTAIHFGAPRDLLDTPTLTHCHDCLAPRGSFHHGGCDAEACPKCGNQLILCGCLHSEDEEQP